MYSEFYHFTKKPFQLNADPDFFFKSIEHRKALAYLRYGLTQGEGFIVVVGRPGTGKTMLVKLLVNKLLNTSNNINIGVMVTSQVQPEDLLKMILSTFGMNFIGDDKHTLLNRIEQFFIQQAKEGKRVLMIVDEAQNLPKASLEELRMLSNFEVNGKSIFQIFLIGQNQLGEYLMIPDMEQLRQRVVATYHLQPLDVEESKNYILFRLEKAGWALNPQFDEAVFAKICQYTQGIPRRINTLCDRILLFGYLEELTYIDTNAVEKVIVEIEEELSNTQTIPADEISSIAHASPIIDPHGSLEDRVQMLEKIILNLQKVFR